MDANIIINAFKPENDYLLAELLKKEDDIACSEIVRLEVLGFSKLTDYDKKDLKEFFATINLIPVNKAIIDHAITIRSQKSIGSPDAIIAATALIFKAKLWTSNKTDFKWISNLNWHDPIRK